MQYNKAELHQAAKDASPSIPVKEELLDIAKGKWELDDTSINGITLWADDKRDEGICLATIYTEAKEYETIATLIVSAPAMYRALLPFKLLAQEVLDVLTKDQTVCEYNGAKITTQDLKNVLTVLFKATPNK